MEVYRQTVRPLVVRRRNRYWDVVPRRGEHWSIRSPAVSSVLLNPESRREGALMLFVGDDWAEDHHDVEVVDDQGNRLARRRLPEGFDGIAALHALIAAHLPEDWVDLEPGQAQALVKVGI